MNEDMSKLQLKGTESRMDEGTQPVMDSMESGMSKLQLEGTVSRMDESTVDSMEDGMSRLQIKGTVSMMDENMMDSMENDMSRLQVKGTVPGMNDSEELSDHPDPPVRRVPCQVLKGLREVKWKEANGWVESDIDREILSTEALPEHLQDYETNMVLVGSDVVNLFPSLEVESVVKEVKEAIKKSKIKWEEIDYREGVRYLALNWDLETCKNSKLRRVLPVRRGKTGTRPGIKGAGPRGKLKGDQEQWIFQKVVLTEWEKNEIISEVVSLATKAMFKNHFYKFGGKIYHQARGGPIGLRGTCAVARIVMQLFDLKWGNILKDLGIVTWLNFRYVDDSRSLLPPIKPGWRWVGGQLVYTKRWEMEDSHVSGELRTKEILRATLMGVVDYLKFTVESGEEYVDGWLPTLDVSLKVDKDNSVQFKFFEKDTCSRKTVHKDSAMEENAKIQTVSNDLVRRLCNTRESMGAVELGAVVDGYGQKLTNSGYTQDQVCRILVNGVKGFEGRKIRCSREGRKLYRTAKESMGARFKKKMLSKYSWYKGARSKAIDFYRGNRRGKKNVKGANSREQMRAPPKTVLFVEQTPMGELGRRLRELVTRLAPVLGFNIKVVERNGSALKSHFPQSSLWDGAPCGRPMCITCTQGAEIIPPCTRKSLVYENVCSTCNPGARAKGELVDVDPTIPSIYVGETSRTVQERAIEHWRAAKGSRKEKEGSHMRKHMELFHGGGEPTFVMRVVQFHRTALSRQCGEAIRIMIRGGAGSVLNSKAEFNRCYIPRLRVEEQDKIEEMEKLEEQELAEVKENLLEEDRSWEQAKGAARSRAARSTLTVGSSIKRGGTQEGIGRKRKKLKYEIVEDDWGEEAGTKTTPGGAGEIVSSLGATEREGAGGLEGGGADHPDHLREAVGGDHPTSLKANSAQPSAEEQQNQSPDKGTGLVEREPSWLLSRTDNQLYSPRCMKQITIEDFFHHETSVNTVDDGGGSGRLRDMVPQVSKEPAPMVTASLSPDDQPDKVVNLYSTTPSMSTNCNQNNMEEVTNKEDILLREEGASKVADIECAIVKKRLWCKTHECAVKCQNVSSKKWQYSEKHVKYMYVSKSVKKYVCPSYRVSQVQLRVKKTDDVKQTNVLGSNYDISCIDDDYSGAVGDEVQCEYLSSDKD